MGWNHCDKSCSGGTDVFDGAPSNVLVSNANTLPTVVTDEPLDFVTASLTNPIAEPAPGYASDFEANVNDAVELICKSATQASYRMDFSGTVLATAPAFLNTYIGVSITTNLGQVFTGGAKFYPVGVSFGGVSPAIDFAVTVYGSIAPNEVVRLELSSNTAGGLIAADVIFFAVKIKPAV